MAYDDSWADRKGVEPVGGDGAQRMKRRKSINLKFHWLLGIQWGTHKVTLV
jgi:hypothetical protein